MIIILFSFSARKFWRVCLQLSPTVASVRGKGHCMCVGSKIKRAVVMPQPRATTRRVHKIEKFFLGLHYFLDVIEGQCSHSYCASFSRTRQRWLLQIFLRGANIVIHMIAGKIRNISSVKNHEAQLLVPPDSVVPAAIGVPMFGVAASECQLHSVGGRIVQ